MHRITGTAGRWCASTILLIVVSVTGQRACAEPQGSRLVPWRVERDILRFRTVATDNVMGLLAIRPGMTILDIGAGTGQFAYEFAGRMNGTGKVYATDANDYCIEYIRKEAERRSLGNLHPVLVRKDGVDDFYRKHRYDLIAVFHISMTYEDQIGYFRDLRGLLKEDGRLVLILYKIPTPFSPGDFTGDFRGLTRELSMEPAGSPYYRVLKDSTRKRIADDPEAEPTAEIRNAIVEEFNGILSDPQFTARFFSGSVYRKELRFSPEERGYADWLLVPFTDANVPNRDVKVQSESGTTMFATINKLILLQRYRKYLKGDGLFVSGFTPRVKAAFGKAGYRLEGEYPDVIPFEDMIVFSAQ